MNATVSQASETQKQFLAMRNISKSFIGVKALDGVNIDLYHREILGICGENGAGKSTLMKILSGSYSSREYEGEIYLNGQPIEFHNTHDARNCGIEMIYQEISLHPDLSIGENIMLGNLPASWPGRVRWKQAYQVAYDLLCRMKLDLDVRTPVRNLSTSKQQLITIARAIA
jgi:ABC-type sugar transport system ATPase subunit